jgi:uncharacterized protein (DUF302 family)
VTPLWSPRADGVSIPGVAGSALVVGGVIAVVQNPDGIVTKRAGGSVDETVSTLIRLVEAKGLTVFAVIDHSGEAAKVGLEMPNTKLVIFGSPAAGTPVMVAAPLAALDLPLKILVWDDQGGTTSISYNAPEYLADRHHLAEELRPRLDAINTIVDVLIKE